MINWDRFQYLFLLGSCGALSIEIIRFYELRGKVHHKKFQMMIRSKIFWVISMMFVFVSGFIAWAFNENNSCASSWQIIVSGMSVSAITKKSLEAFSANGRIDAGDVDFEIKDIFR